jgi:hypothetical protein
MNKTGKRSESYGVERIQSLVQSVEALQLRLSKVENTLGDLVIDNQELRNELSNRDKISAKSPPKSKEFRMPFGKHKGMSFDEIEDEDENYLDWIEENMDNERIQEELAKWKGV